MIDLHRLATADDFDAVYAIYMHEDVIPFLSFDPMSKADFASVFQDLRETGTFHVVEVAGEVRGIYKATRHAGRAAHVAILGTLAVSPDVRGSGFAQAMVEEAIALLNTQGVTRVELIVEADNPRAQRFYRRLGFECEGTKRCAYKRSSDDHPVDQIMMALLLPPALAMSLRESTMLLLQAEDCRMNLGPAATVRTFPIPASEE